MENPCFLSIICGILVSLLGLSNSPVIEKPPPGFGLAEVSDAHFAVHKVYRTKIRDDSWSAFPWQPF